MFKTKRVFSLGCAMGFFFSITGATVLRAQHHQPQQGQEHQKGMQGHEQQQGMVEVGNKGEVSFAVETKVGDLTLRPGLYRFQHRVENGGHYVRFTELGKRGIKEEAGEVKCAIEPAGEEFSRTAVFSGSEGGMNHVARIEVRGENVVHVF